MLDFSNIIQFFMNVERNSHFGQELLRIIREFKCRNLLLKAGYGNRIQLTFATFKDLIPESCVVKEI